MKLIWILSVSLILSAPAYAEKSNVEKWGDYIQIALPVSSGALSLYKAYQDDKDWHVYFVPYLKALTAGVATVHLSKHVLDKTRPNGASTFSFPSGHTHAAFSGAAFNHSLYGYKLGIPSYLAAAYVGFSRIDSDKHFADDVLAGAAIAMLYNWAFTNSLRKESEIVPNFSVAADGSSQVGLSAPLSSFTLNRSFSLPQLSARFNFGPAFISRVSLGKENQKIVDYEEFKRSPQEIYTSDAELKYYLNQDSSLYFNFSPFQFLNRAENLNSFDLFGENFTASPKVKTDFKLYEFSLGYSYGLKLLKPLKLFLKAELYTAYTDLSVEDLNSSTIFKDSFWKNMVTFAVEASYRPWNQLEFSALFRTMKLAGDSIRQYKIASSYRLSQRWGLELSYLNSYRRFSVESFTDGLLKNNQSRFYLGVTRHFF